MADRVMTENAAKAFLAARPAVELSADPQPSKAAKHSKRAARPWRVDKVWLQMLCDGFAKYTKSALDREIGILAGQLGELSARVTSLESELSARIAELEARGAPEGDFSMCHYNAEGNVLAEFWQRNGIAALRLDGKKTTQAKVGSERAKRLLRQFEEMSP